MNSYRALAPASVAIALTLALAPACASRQSAGTTRMPDGSINIKCDGPLTGCIAQADSICKGNTYEVLRARDQRDRFGPANGTSQVEVRSSEATIRCSTAAHPIGPNAGTAEEVPNENFRLRRAEPEGPDGAGTAAAAANATIPPLTARVCVPGATQACIGPGKCEGGQACLPDGSAFAPCDCGTIGAPIQAPAGAASPPNPGTAPSGDASSGAAGAKGAPPSSTGAKGRGADGAPPPPTVPGAVPPATPLKKR